MQIIDIQYRDGRPDEQLADEDLRTKWDEVIETPGILHAAYRVPKRSREGFRLAGELGLPRDEQDAQQAARQAEREERDRAAHDRMVAKRTWEWTAPNMNSHL